jgi:hypothetical protein
MNRCQRERRICKQGVGKRKVVVLKSGNSPQDDFDAIPVPGAAALPAGAWAVVSICADGGQGAVALLRNG